MYTVYLKKLLTEIVGLNADVTRIREQNKTPEGYPSYPAICGGMDATVSRAVICATSALSWTTDQVEPAEREAQRVQSVLESLDIETDDETLATLELIGASGDLYRSERNSIRDVVRMAVASVQESEREIEHDDATAALLKAGFVHDEDDDVFNRGVEQVRIELVGGYESRYKWEYETSEPLHRMEIGKSGEFDRLLSACGVSLSSEPCETGTVQ